MGAQQIYSSKKQADGLKKSAVAGDPDAQLVLGNILLGSGRYEEAERMLSAAAAWHPLATKSKLTLAELHAAQGEMAKAEQVLEGAEEGLAAEWERSQAGAEAGDEGGDAGGGLWERMWGGGQADAQPAVMTPKLRARAWFNVAYKFATRLGKVERAYDMLVERALPMEARARVEQLAGECAARLGREAAARAHFRRCLELPAFSAHTASAAEVELCERGLEDPAAVAGQWGKIGFGKEAPDSLRAAQAATPAGKPKASKAAASSDGKKKADSGGW